MTSSSSFIRSGQHHRLRSVTVRQDCLIVVMSGEKRLHTAQGLCRIRAGEALAIKRDAQMDVENIPPTQGAYVAKILCFSDTSVNKFAPCAVNMHSHVRSPVFQKMAFATPLTDCFAHACKALEAPEQHSASIQEHRIQEVLLALSDVGVVFAPNRHLTWTERVHRLVSQRPSALWDCAHVAHTFHLSTASLQRRLAAENTSLAACVRDCRLTIAMGLLQSTDQPIGDIASTCGYRSVSKFSAAFRQRFGALPSGLR
jgi:AraC-like DNA-binding protein